MNIQITDLSSNTYNNLKITLATDISDRSKNGGHLLAVGIGANKTEEMGGGVEAAYWTKGS